MLKKDKDGRTYEDHVDTSESTVKGFVIGVFTMVILFSLEMGIEGCHLGG